MLDDSDLMTYWTLGKWEQGDRLSYKLNSKKQDWKSLSVLDHENMTFYNLK